MAAGKFDEASAVDLELQPGQRSLHEVYMIHGAAAAKRPLWPLKGVDRSGRNDFEVGHRRAAAN